MHDFTALARVQVGRVSRILSRCVGVSLVIGQIVHDAVSADIGRLLPYVCYSHGLVMCQNMLFTESRSSLSVVLVRIVGPGPFHGLRHGERCLLGVTGQFLIKSVVTHVVSFLTILNALHVNSTAFVEVLTLQVVAGIVLAHPLPRLILSDPAILMRQRNLRIVTSGLAKVVSHLLPAVPRWTHLCSLLHVGFVLTHI